MAASSSSHQGDPEYDLLKEGLDEHALEQYEMLRKEMDGLEHRCKFQADNVRNERNHIFHLLINTQYSVHEEMSAKEAIDLLAKKTFENYMLWSNYCKRWLGHSSRDHIMPDDNLQSLCLYYLIWGEAANLRFMPECLCFIFHKMKESVSNNYEAEGPFLQNVITPVYSILKYEKDNSPNPVISHGHVANYDDINELFWSSQCKELFNWDIKNMRWDIPVKSTMVDKWKRRRHKKVNFVERRVFLHIFHSFHRLWIFFIIMLQVLVIIAFTGGLSLKYLLLTAPTHAFLMFFQSLLDIVFTYGAHVKHSVRIAVQFIFYAAATAIQTFLVIKRFQENTNETSIDYITIYQYVALFYLIAHLLHIIGYILLGFLPAKTAARLKWIFKESYFIGNNMRVKPSDFFKYATFWIILLSAKFIVSFETQIKPLVNPTKTIVALKNVNYAWHDIISKNHYNVLTLVSIWSPIYFLDTQIWYVVFSAVLGCISGGIAKLGEMRSMYMFARHFRRMPERFEKHLVAEGDVKENSFQIYWNEIIKKMREEDYLTNEEQKLLVMPEEKNANAKWPLFVLVNEVQHAIWLSANKHKDELMRKLKRREGYLHDAIKEIFYRVGDIFDELGIWKDLENRAAFDMLENKIYRDFNHAKTLLEFRIPITSSTIQRFILVFLKRFTLETWDDKLADLNQNLPLERLKSLLNGKINVVDIPQNDEAKRRLIFFGNSLLGKMPEAPPAAQMLSFSVLTPHYKEEVLYSLKGLNTKNKDGITDLYYLQLVYDDEWKNFKERVKHDGVDDVRLWASYRGQTLARTVRGMMYYFDALNLQASISESRSIPSGNLAQRKFTYVVTSQNYGQWREDKDPKAADIEFLMKKHPTLRVAYIDSENRTHWSKLAMVVRDEKQEQKIVTVYSIKLPGEFLIGEGKPENQNHAIIFTRGEALQTIDMNQDNSFEEALKMRNLLQELKRKEGKKPPSILGVREHVFTGSVSSLAWFMSNQETTFVTLGQRVMANPLNVRMHYGHPDVFDRIFHITRGGISKASKAINLSEDIFAGYNSTLRGGRITHHEYIQVGKGRDLGLNQISSFEAKVSGGNGEQILSRDVYRLGRFFDFWRMLSFYYTSVGFYISTAMIVVALYAYLYGKVYMVLSGVEKEMLNIAGIEGNHELESVLATQAIFQFGFLNCAPMVMGYILEQGFLKALEYFILMWLLGSFIFFAFSLATRAHYFGRTILHGGAKYRSTGRGFVIEHIQFAENYRFYSRSHFVKGLEIAMLLIVYVVYGVDRGRTGYAFLITDIGFLSFCWIYAPFFFNPLSFEWQKTVEDLQNWNRWLSNKSFSARDTDSWQTWWDEQTNLGGWRARAAEILLSSRFFLIQFGVAYHLKEGVGSNSLLVYASSWVLFFCIGFLVAFMSLSPRSGNKIRFFHFIIFMFLIAAFVTGCVFTVRFQLLDIVASILALIPTGWGLISIGIACKPCIQKTGLWWLVSTWAWSYDVGMGYIVLAPIVLLSWFPFISPLHSRILFNHAFSRGLEVSVLLSDTQKGTQPSTN